MPESQSGSASACMGQLKCTVTSNHPNAQSCLHREVVPLHCKLTPNRMLCSIESGTDLLAQHPIRTYQGQKPSEGMTGWESMNPFTRFGGTFICWARPAHSGPSSWLSAAMEDVANSASTARKQGQILIRLKGWMGGSGGSRLRKALAGTGGGGKRGTSAAASEVIHTLASSFYMSRGVPSGREVRLQAARALQA